MSATDRADELQTTPDGTEYRIAGGRVVVPTPDHPDAGGIDITEDAADEILTDILLGRESGTHKQLLDWELTGTTTDTRAGESKDIRVTKTSFGTERTATLTLVDIADFEVAAQEA